MLIGLKMEDFRIEGFSREGLSRREFRREWFNGGMVQEERVPKESVQVGRVQE